MGRKVATELVKIAKELVADYSKPFAQEQLEKAISSLRTLPVWPVFSGADRGDARGKKAQKKLDTAVALLEEIVNDMPTPVIYEVIVGTGPSYGMRKHTFDDVVELDKWCYSNGFGLDGFAESGSALRKELIGQPKFRGLIGPMYGGPKKVRYETPKVNDFLSQ